MTLIFVTQFQDIKDIHCDKKLTETSFFDRLFENNVVLHEIRAKMFNYKSQQNIACTIATFPIPLSFIPIPPVSFPLFHSSAPGYVPARNSFRVKKQVATRQFVVGKQVRPV